MAWNNKMEIGLQVVRKTKKWRVETHLAEMQMLHWMCEVTRKDWINNESIRGHLRVSLMEEKIQECN